MPLIAVSLVFSAGVGVDHLAFVGQPPVAPEEFALIRESWDLLHSEYVRAPELDSVTMAHAAVDAMTEAVGDTGHTAFYSPEDVAAEDMELGGSYVGIGVVLDETGPEPVVSTVYPDSPASRAGLEVGDRFVEIDGRATAGLDDAALTSVLGGPEGSSVGVWFERAGSKGSIEIRVVRGVVKVPRVDWAIVPGTRVALVRLALFGDGVADELAAALRATRAAHASGIILDLRQNPGGFLTEAVSSASRLIATGDILQARDATGAVAPSTAEGDAVDTTTPLVVLVDADSASSSEVVASAIQEAGRGTVVGEPTFGTGTILSPYELDDGSELWIGTQEWLTRNGRSLWHVGLTPDVAVSRPTGAPIVTPGDLARLGPRGIKTSKDAQLLSALGILAKR